MHTHAHIHTYTHTPTLMYMHTHAYMHTHPHKKFQGVDVSTKDPHTVVLLLDSPEVAIVCKACEALHKHMEKCKQHTFYNNHVLGSPFHKH